MSDLIERNTIKKELLKWTTLPPECEYDVGYNEAMLKAREIVENAPTVNRWVLCSDRLPDMRTRVFVVAVRNRKHYPKDTEPSRMFIAMRIEMLSDCEWYWAEATDIYGYNGIGGMLALGGWKVVAWMPMLDTYESPEVNSNE